MIRLLVEGQETVARTARSVFPAVEKASDEPTAELLTQRMQVHGKSSEVRSRPVTLVRGGKTTRLF
jgi:starvation-inducible DNA-binding protein